MVDVPSVFPSAVPAPIAFIGEAPGVEEMEERTPLVGKSGRVFDALMRTSKLWRPDHLVGNVFSTQLPNNDVSAWCAPAAEAKAEGFDDIPPIRGAGYLRPEHRHHLERLRNDLEQAQPTVIVPMGGTALWALLGSGAISQFRGAICAAEYLVPGVKMVPTYHPAFVMRQWKMFVVVVGDLMKAQREVERGPEVVYPKRRLLLEPTIDEVCDYLEDCKTSPLLSVDIETAKGEITCIGFAPTVEDAICVPFTDDRKPSGRYWPTAEKEFLAWSAVKDLMEHPVPKVGQNFCGYDAYWLLVKMGIRTRNLLHDTRLMHHALYPELPKSLEFMGATYTDQGPWKNWRGGHKEKRDD